VEGVVAVLCQGAGGSAAPAGGRSCSVTLEDVNFTNNTGANALTDVGNASACVTHDSPVTCSTVWRQSRPTG
jgi:hypothetical protein